MLRQAPCPILFQTEIASVPFTLNARGTTEFFFPHCTKRCAVLTLSDFIKTAGICSAIKQEKYRIGKDQK